MIRVAHERVADLFGLALSESAGGSSSLADRYVTIARRVGMRYNVRFPPEYREYSCRACSVFWVEGRSVRTRLRSGVRVRTCLRCGHVRRVPLGVRTSSPMATAEFTRPLPGTPGEPAAVDEEGPIDFDDMEE
ncbi:MAG: hypothetical protein L3K09_06500 [Thermoplasmata archaeon]|nr:hypothetical protein [Thermoplasmata archaeon]